MVSARALHVLVVDDDEADFLMIEEALETAAVPPVVTRVADGTQALDFLRRRGCFRRARRPDLVLLDLNLPRMSGHQVLTAMKRDACLRAIPVVVLTTSSAREDVAASYREQASAFVTKPMDYHSFEAALRTINDLFQAAVRREAESEAVVLPFRRRR
ncbi:response regulator [Actinoplanes siamensis]|uniref:Two-component system response regulator n=1 Tax=Actinoplanes siamensis TaxID=1223317 RepID=A0A919N3X8_9ACTN|nr:response regulator [Actinoplanes siamensis]GIF03935.1 two-component system response regulator [Actinoplanes siamensis]